MNNFSQQKDGTEEFSEGTNLSPFSVENLEDELIQDILETLENIENYPTDSSCEVTLSNAPNAPLQVAITDESPGL